VSRRRAPALIALAGAVVLTGCGLGAGRGTSDVNLTVTRNFGANLVGHVSEKQVPGSETVMRMLERQLPVQTRYGGGFVESIDHISGNSSRHDWFYYVNGVEASIGAANTAVHKGDQIWWDLHDWSVTDDVRAVVGSYPEPFVHGVGGKRLPTTLECATNVGAACDVVATALKAIGVPVAKQLLGTGSGSDSIGLLVGTWDDLKGSLAGDLLTHGPKTSGIYASFTGPTGASLELLSPQGQVKRRLGAGAGLVAATRDQVSQPTWMVTGTDVAGVLAAARALDVSRLHDHFALAVSGGSDLPVPLGAGS
jgi:Domain of unknown function (DUF4430)